MNMTVNLNIVQTTNQFGYGNQGQQSQTVTQNQ